jgi:hypothetical protein
LPASAERPSITCSTSSRAAQRLLLVLLIGLLAALVPSADLDADETSVWLSADELAALPTSGGAWERVRAVAEEPLPEPSDLGVRDDHNVRTLAAALVGVRLDDAELQAKAERGLRTVLDTAPTDDLLAAARRLGTYAITADVLDLERRDPSLHEEVRAWAGRELHRTYGSGSGGASTIVEVHERRPNNWGTHAGASRIAVAVLRGDHGDLEQAAEVFRGWLGDRSAHDGFRFGALDWQADPDAPVGVNPAGARLDGADVDGVLPDDQRRGGGVSWPPPRENYVWEALQGATVQAQLLERQGFDAWSWQDDALERAVTWLHDVADFPAEGDDTWIPHLVNHATGTDFPAVASRPGKNLGFTDWTHAERPATSDPEPSDPDPSDPGPSDPDPSPGSGDAHAAAIEAVLAAGIAEGYPDGTFRPARAVTRGQMASFLARAVGLEEGAGRSFSDAHRGVHAGAIEAVAAAGIAEGYPDGTFRPARAVTRGQMASFLVRSFDLS